MQNFNQLAVSMFNLLTEICSFKTKQYFLGNLKMVEVKVGPGDTDTGKTAQEILDVLSTLFTCLGKESKRSPVEVSGESYPISDYQFPANMWELAKARKIYVSRDAVDRMDPYFEIDDVPGNVLTPRQVSRFFEMFNVNQFENDKIVVSACPDSISWDPSVLCDCKAFMDESDTQFISFNENGTIPIEVIQILSVYCPDFSEELLYHYPAFDWRYLTTWLVLRNR